MAFSFSTTCINAGLNAIETAIGASPVLKLRSGAMPANVAAADSGTALATITLPSDWLGAASGGEKLLSGTWSGTGDAAAGAGTNVGHFRIYASDGITAHVQGTVIAGSEPNDGQLVLSSINIASGQPVTISSFIVMSPEVSLPLKVVALGDSQTAAFQGYSDQWALDNPAIPYVNLAVGGSLVGVPSDYGTASTNVWGQADNAIAAAPSIVTILTGGNDDAASSYGRGGALGFYDVVAALADKLKLERPGIKVVVIGILPDGNATTQNANRATINPLYRSAVGTTFDEYIPLGEHPDFTDSAANTADGSGSMKADKVHMSDPPGGQATAKLLYAAVINPLVAGTVSTIPALMAAIADATGGTGGATVTRNAVVTGLTPGQTATFSVNTGRIGRNQGALGTASVTAKNGDTLVLEQTYSATGGATVSQTLSATGFSESWDAITAAAVARVAYIKTYTIAPQANWNAFNDIYTLGTKVANIKDSAEVSTGWALVMDNVPDGDAASNGAPTSAISWVPSSVLNSFIYSDTAAPHATFRLTGLNNAKTYTIDLVSCRNAGTTRNTIFTVEGVDLAQINSALNVSTFSTASSVSPGGDGQISISLRPGTPNEVGFAYMNAIRITEN